MLKEVKPAPNMGENNNPLYQLDLISYTTATNETIWLTKRKEEYCLFARATAIFNIPKYRNEFKDFHKEEINKAFKYRVLKQDEAEEIIAMAGKINSSLLPDNISSTDGTKIEFVDYHDSARNLDFTYESLDDDSPLKRMVEELYAKVFISKIPE